MKKKEKELKDLAKFEAAEELGLADKARRVGWGNLTSKETGRIGAVMKDRKKKENGRGKAP